MFLLAALCSVTIQVSAQAEPEGLTVSLAAEMTWGREFPTFSVLNDGRVLAVGNVTSNGSYGGAQVVPAPVEVYDPATNTWQLTGSLATPRGGHSATVLQTGEVLVAGGSASPSAESYDPGTGTFTEVGPMSVPRGFHTATLLPDGRVLIAGGGIGYGPTKLCEIYDPIARTWSATAAMSVAREQHIAALLPDGRVLVAGGVDRGTYRDSGEVFDPAGNGGTGSWTSVAGAMTQARAEHVAVTLATGQVLVLGGRNSCCYHASAELYDPASGVFSPVAQMTWPRAHFAAARLPDGSVLVTGGYPHMGQTEVFTPAADGGPGSWITGPPLFTPRFRHGATALPNGTIVAGGGFGGGWNALQSIEVFSLPSPADVSGPLASALVLDPNPVMVGMGVLLTASASDTTTGGSPIAWASYRLDDGASLPMDAADGAFDGATEAVAATLPPFASAGVHTVCVRADDARGNVGAEECAFLAVYDPNGGFVTGGGWIRSPAGAWTADPSLGGKASFGFVSKYEPGRTEPTGNTQFQFQAAGFSFRSTSYEWLVVAGARAQYKGTGTVNGAGAYGFILTAIDGAAPGGQGIDRFRLKVYGQNQGEAVLYDNELGLADTGDPTTALGGGSVVIHR